MLVSHNKTHIGEEIYAVLISLIATFFIWILK